jgi:hypothetical protein
MGLHAGHYTIRILTKSLGEHATDERAGHRRDVLGMLKLDACACRYGLDICFCSGRVWKPRLALSCREDILQGSGIEKLHVARNP